MKLTTLLLRSDTLHAALSEAVGTLEDVPNDHRATVTLDVLMVASQHGHAVRHLLAQDLCVSAIGLLRMQYEAVLRAVWALFAAAPSDLAALAAPLTRGTSKAAKSLGMPGELLGAVDKSEAPPDLKRTLREFRTSSWDFLNSYIHAGIHPLRRHEAHLEHELTTALRMSNGLAAITSGLMVIVAQQPRRQADINVVCIGFQECLPARHTPEGEAASESPR
jgi:hypothetical protein